MSTDIYTIEQKGHIAYILKEGKPISYTHMQTGVVTEIEKPKKIAGAVPDMKKVKEALKARGLWDKLHVVEQPEPPLFYMHSRQKAKAAADTAIRKIVNKLGHSCSGFNYQPFLHLQHDS